MSSFRERELRGVLGPKADALLDEHRGRSIEIFQSNDRTISREGHRLFDPDYVVNQDKIYLLRSNLDAARRVSYELISPGTLSETIDHNQAVRATPPIAGAIRRYHWIMGRVHDHGYAAYLVPGGYFREVRVDLGGSRDKIIDAVVTDDGLVWLLMRAPGSSFYLVRTRFEATEKCPSHHAEIARLEKLLAERHRVRAYFVESNPNRVRTSSVKTEPAAVIDLAGACPLNIEADYVETLRRLVAVLPPRPNEIQIDITSGERLGYQGYRSSRGYNRG